MSGPSSAIPPRIEDYALSVLLHDIGKFWERASDAPRPTPAELQRFCPRHPQTGSFTHLHAALSARFIEELVGIPGAERWGPRHHLPDETSREEVCSHLADQLASGETESDESREAPNAATTPLKSIFSSLVIGGQSIPPRFLPLTRLDSLEEALSPRAVAPVSREDYRFHWNHFLNAIDKLGSPLVDLETWCALLQVFASRIPAASTNRQLKTIPDIDLFTHSRLVAALAVALYKGPRTDEDLLALRSRLFSPERAEPGPPWIDLVGGALSGLESFLSGGNARSLQERHLFVELLTEAAARRLASVWELAFPSILFLTPGRFVILAPAGAPLDGIREEVEGVLLKETGGALGMEIVSIGLRLDDLRFGGGRGWSDLEDLLEKARASGWTRRAHTCYDAFFGSEDCDSPRSRFEGRFEIGLEDPGALLKARFLVRRRPDGPGGPEGFRRGLAALGAWVEGLEEVTTTDGIEAIYSLGRLDLEGLARARGGRSLTLGFRWTSLGAGNGEAALGSAPAALSVQVEGLERALGEGLPPGGGGLARVLVLLESLRQLFAGWGGSEIKRRHREGLFLLGADQRGLAAAGGALSLADFLQALWRKFESAFGHPALQLSAGLAEAASLPTRKSPRGGVVSFFQSGMPFTDLSLLRETAGWLVKADPLCVRKLGDFLSRLTALESGSTGLEETRPDLSALEIRAAILGNRWEREVIEALRSGHREDREALRRIEWLEGWIQDGGGRIREPRLRSLVSLFKLLRGATA